MIHLLVTFCAVENCPVEFSQFHSIARQTFGDEVAQRLTYEAVIPPWEESHDQVAAGTISTGLGADIGTTQGVYEALDYRGATDPLFDYCEDPGEEEAQGCDRTTVSHST